jgi:hypothetical protein
MRIHCRHCALELKFAVAAVRGGQACGDEKRRRIEEPPGREVGVDAAAAPALRSHLEHSARASALCRLAALAALASLFLCGLRLPEWRGRPAHARSCHSP